MKRQRRRIWEASCFHMYIKMIPTDKLRKAIEIPDGVEIEIGEKILVKGPNGTVEKKLISPFAEIKKEDKKIIIEPKNFTKRAKKIINTFNAHIKNMIKGVQESFVYKLKIVSSHFPMNVSVENDKVVIKNFYGEKVPRIAKILPGTKVKVDGDIVIVESPDKEKAGQTAANIELATKRLGYDRRLFQDGIWIIEKAGKPIK